MEVVLSVLIAIAIVLAAYFYFSRSASSGGQVSLQQPLTDGKKMTDTGISIPESSNQQQGLTFSYACWFLVNDFSYQYGKPKVIFTKGTEDLKTMCPALMIDATTNSLLVKMDTFGITEVVTIPSIPAKKWIHFALAVDQDSMDVYIDGLIHTHHSISQLPKQNASTVKTSVAGGFDGKLGQLSYFNYFLTPEQVSSLASQMPPHDAEDQVGSLPPYFDSTWYTGRTR